MLLAFGLQIGHIDIALRVAGGDDNFHARHLRAGRVRAVRRRRDQADVALALAVRFQISLDDQQPGVFALRTGIGLQADARVAGGLTEPVAQLLIQLGVALQLIVRRKRVNVRKLGPSDGNHLAASARYAHASARKSAPSTGKPARF